MAYKKLDIIDVTDVPNWERRKPKWADLADDVEKLEPGQTLVVEFDDEKAAKRAQNAVRDTVNLKARAVILRTRVVVEEDGKSILYLMRTHPS
jgi:TusA-related sulfurtransferase